MIDSNISKSTHIGFVEPLRVSAMSSRSDRLEYDRLQSYTDSATQDAREWNKLFWSKFNSLVSSHVEALEPAKRYTE